MQNSNNILSNLNNFAKKLLFLHPNFTNHLKQKVAPKILVQQRRINIGLTKITKTSQDHLSFKHFLLSKRFRYIGASVLDFLCIVIIIANGIAPAQRIVSPFVASLKPLQPITVNKSNYEVFGFAPYWNFNKLETVDFNALTTFAYFGVPVLDDGSLDTTDPGYQTFKSDQATKLFKRAHQSGTRVVLTLTQMHNQPILSLLDNPDAQQTAIDQAVGEVKNRGIDGINVDFEYTGDPGQQYRTQYSQFIKNLTDKMHQEIPESKVTVSVYASAIKEPKIYDISNLSKNSDGIFMMAYDFAVAGSDNAIPTSPLHGHQNGKYWYDVATAVDDFLKYMEPSKLILGVPWYGYNYLVYTPEVKAETKPYYSWQGTPRSQTYADVQDKITDQNPEITNIETGWDKDGEVGYKAYYVPQTGTWRMIFIEDVKSLGIKYDFAKTKNLAGVGMWALGNDNGKRELWDLLLAKFGSKIADSSVINKQVF